jgi:hypothetical protein
LLSQDNLRGKKIVVANFLKNSPQVADLLAEGGNFLNSRTAVRCCRGSGSGRMTVFR